MDSKRVKTEFDELCCLSLFALELLTRLPHLKIEKQMPYNDS